MARAAAREHVRASFSQDHDSAGRRAEGKAIGATPPPPLSASCNAAPSAVITRAYPTKGLCCRGGATWARLHPRNGVACFSLGKRLVETRWRACPHPLLPRSPALCG